VSFPPTLSLWAPYSTLAAGLSVSDSSLWAFALLEMRRSSYLTRSAMRGRHHSWKDTQVTIAGVVTALH
jgi:hypothetical protein